MNSDTLIKKVNTICRILRICPRCNENQMSTVLDNTYKIQYYCPLCGIQPNYLTYAPPPQTQQQYPYPYTYYAPPQQPQNH